ncbi:ABC transporter substrate-binding protein [Bacillus sp. FJAT-29790]|uniref:ABC transporter substrate-binding protein n=1 Tax=Bacillus sp. FJAT-29790 TaxID=1895002 RepID=UPI001C237B2E|nr:ABC transporter substrate-binding protein [Bacillus sp. FJAT-29790]MBU8880657.1 ABC transporter substrate-binding protein [Bacillus sp. FJAT-29790]
MKKNFKKAMYGLAASSLLFISGCGGSSTSSSDSESKKLIVVSWGGDYQQAQKDAIFDPYVKETGVKLIEDSPVDIGKLKAMVKNNNVEWDVVDVLGTDIPILASEGLLEPIDYSIVNKSEMLDGTVQEFAVSVDLYANVLSYNEENLPNGKAPEDWKDFFDESKFPGRRAMEKTPVQTLEFALMADGVDPKGLYPLDVDRAFNKLDTIKKEIIWWDQRAQVIQLLADKEVILAAAPNGRIAAAAEKGQPLAFTFNQGILDHEAWVVPKGSKNKEEAMKFIAFASKAEQQANLLKVIPYGPANKNTFELMSEDYAIKLPTHPDNVDKQVMVDAQWWFENFDKVNDRFQQWLLE